MSFFKQTILFIFSIFALTLLGTNYLYHQKQDQYKTDEADINEDSRLLGFDNIITNNRNALKENGIDNQKAEAILLELINEYRHTISKNKSIKLPGLSFRSDLYEITKKHTENMAKQKSLYHNDLKKVMNELNARDVAENVAYFQNSANMSGDQVANQIFTQWQNSPGHNKNMLKYRIDNAAATIIKDSNGLYFSTLLLAKF